MNPSLIGQTRSYLNAMVRNILYGAGIHVCPHTLRTWKCGYSWKSVLTGAGASIFIPRSNRYMHAIRQAGIVSFHSGSTDRSARITGPHPQWDGAYPRTLSLSHMNENSGGITRGRALKAPIDYSEHSQEEYK